MSNESLEAEITVSLHFHISCANSAVAFNEDLLHEFQQVFKMEPADAIAWAFRAHRDRVSYFPAICDIRYLIDYWHCERRDAEWVHAQNSSGEGA